MNIFSRMSKSGSTTHLSAVEARELIADLYRQILGREPDAEGWDHYSAELLRGSPVSQIVKAFATSDEAQERRVRVTRALEEASGVGKSAPLLPEAEARELVADLYRLFLGREPDAQGWDHYSSELMHGSPAVQIVKTFAYSDEARERRKNETFAFISTRFPDYSPPSEWGKIKFLQSNRGDSIILDIGCGNDSPKITKSILPHCFYIGLDIGDYHQNSKNIADKYILKTSPEFAGAIEDFENSVDIVISSHNLEHCEDRGRVLVAMCRALKAGGRIYISFPCTDSLNFPNRQGTLNYYDDATHVGVPPDFGEVISTLKQNGLHITYATTRYQPPIGWLIGLSNEERSRNSGELLPNSWDFWGFETIIWAERPADARPDLDP
jgi:SAM-dependent methyltransferase